MSRDDWDDLDDLDAERRVKMTRNNWDDWG